MGGRAKVDKLTAKVLRKTCKRLQIQQQQRVQIESSRRSRLEEGGSKHLVCCCQFKQMIKNASSN